MKPNTANEKLNAMLDDLRKQTTLRPNELTEEIQTTNTAVYAALLTGRAQLLRGASPKSLTPEEISQLYRTMSVLIDTNVALRTHAEQLSNMMELWMSSFKGMHTVAERIEDFAKFRTIGEREDTRDE